MDIPDWSDNSIRILEPTFGFGEVFSFSIVYVSGDGVNKTFNFFSVISNTLVGFATMLLPSPGV